MDAQVVGCIVEHEGKILLCKRAIDPCKGKWTLPAGYMELKESSAGQSCHALFLLSPFSLPFFSLASFGPLGRISSLYVF